MANRELDSVRQLLNDIEHKLDLERAKVDMAQSQLHEVRTTLDVKPGQIMESVATIAQLTADAKHSCYPSDFKRGDSRA